MIHLSVNVNKVATLRNSRGGREPSVLEAVDVCVMAGVAGITVHPRADRRHITPQDVHDIARRLEGRRPEIEFRALSGTRRNCSSSCEQLSPINAPWCRSLPARSPARRDGPPDRKAKASRLLCRI
jgi:pyridoxine 5-phosphate synthase